MPFALLTQPGYDQDGMDVVEVASLTRKRLTWNEFRGRKWLNAVHVQSVYETDDQAYGARYLVKKALEDWEYDSKAESRLIVIKNAIKASPGYCSADDWIEQQKANSFRR